MTHSEQRRRIWITVASLVALMMVFVVGIFWKITTPRQMSPQELLANGAIVFDHPRIIEPFNLLDQQQQAFTKQNLEGRWTILYFGFTHCPDVCPNDLAFLNQWYKSLDESIAARTEVVMVSLDPARDNAAHLAQYMSYFNPDFHGVTGEFMNILRFSRNVNVAFSKVPMGDDYTIDHTANLVLVNPKGDYHGFFKPPFKLAPMKTAFQSIVSQF